MSEVSFEPIEFKNGYGKSKFQPRLVAPGVDDIYIKSRYPEGFTPDSSDSPAMFSKWRAIWISRREYARRIRNRKKRFHES